MSGIKILLFFLPKFSSLEVPSSQAIVYCTNWSMSTSKLVFVHELPFGSVFQRDFRESFIDDGAVGGDGCVEFGRDGHGDVTCAPVGNFGFFGGEVECVESGGTGGADGDVGSGACHGDFTGIAQGRVDALACEAAEFNVASSIVGDGQGGFALQGGELGGLGRSVVEFQFRGGQAGEVGGGVVGDGDVGTAVAEGFAELNLEAVGGVELQGGIDFQVVDFATAFSVQREFHFLSRNAVHGDVSVAFVLDFGDNRHCQVDGNGEVGGDFRFFCQTDGQGFAFHFRGDELHQIGFGLNVHFRAYRVGDIQVEVDLIGFNYNLFEGI